MTGKQALNDRLVDAFSKIGSFGSGAAAGGIVTGGNPLGALLGGSSALVLPPLAKASARSYRTANINALLDELGGGKTVDPAVKKIINQISGGVGGGSLARRENKRRKRKKNGPR